MGQLAMGIAGGIIGSLFGMPQLGFLVGSMLGGVLFGSSSGQSGPKLTDLHVTSSTYGKPIVWGWGTARIGGNVIQAGLLKQHKHSQGKGGGMGGGGATSYTYSSTHAVALCSTEFTGPIQNVLKIWADTKLVYDCTGQSGVTRNIPGSGGGGKGGGGHDVFSAVLNGGITNAFNKIGRFRVYTGTQDQLPDPALEALLPDPTDQVPYRGLAYVVMDDIDLTNYGSRVPNWTFEVTFANTGPGFSQNSFKFNFNTTMVGTPAADGVALDSFRQRAYFFNPGTGPTAGIHAMSLATGNEVMSSTNARSFSTGVTGDMSFIDEAPIVANDGYLYFWGGGGNYGVLNKMDPDTLLVTAKCGTPDPFNSTAGSIPLYYWAVPYTLNHGNYLLTSGLFGAMYLTNVDTMSPAANLAFSEPRMRIIGGTMTGADAATAFGIGSDNAFGGGSVNPISIYRIDITHNSLGKTLLATYLPSNIDSDWSTFVGVADPVFDATDGNLITFLSTFDTVSLNHYKAYIVKIRATDGGIMWKTPYDTTVYGSVPGPNNYQTIVSSGILSFIDGLGGTPAAHVWTVNTQDGSVVSIAPWNNHLNAGFQVWADSFGAILFNGHYDPNGDGWQCLVTNQSGQGQLVSSIVADVCHAVGFVDSDLDVAELTDKCEGFVLDSQMMAADALKPLAATFMFDGVESDYKLKFVKRGTASIASVPSSDFAYLDKAMNEMIAETRLQEIDLPSQVTINFLDPNHDYQTATQYARRPAKPYPVTYSKAGTTANLPVVAEPGFMKQLAEKLLYTAWIERVSYKAHLHWGYLKYDPTDILTYTLTDDTQVTVRMVNMNLGADLTMEWNAVSESAPTYSSVATTLGGQGFVQQLLTLSSATRLFLLDMPLLRDTDDTGQAYTLLYDAAGGYGPTWAGANIDMSADDTTFTAQPPIPSATGALWGSATTALGDVASPWIVDTVNTVTLNMVTGGTSLASATLLQVCNGANVGVLFDSIKGTLEVIQWLTVTTNADGSYTLSNLLRGRRGTEVFTGTHSIGETFVVLDPHHLSTIKMTLGDLNLTRYFRAVTNGTAVEDANIQTFVDTGRTWKPYAPVQQKAVTSGSDIQLSWVRRTRFGGELASYTGDVPLSEQAESYEVDIYNGAGNTVLRTLRVDNGATPVANPGVLYTAAQIAADFGSAPASLNIAVYQISTVVGRGFGKMVNVKVN